MKPLAITVALVVAVGIGVIACRAETTVHWLGSYDDAVAEAKAAHGLVFVDIYTDSTESSDPNDHPTSALTEALAHYVPVRVNADRDGKSVASKYGITQFPSFLILKPDGTLVEEEDGNESANELTTDLNGVANAFAMIPGLVDKVNANPMDYISMSKLGLAYAATGDNTDAVRCADMCDLAGETAGLPQIYDIVGTSLLNAGDNVNAAVEFQKAIAASASDGDLLTARMGIAEAYLNENDDTKAKPALQALLNTPGLSPTLKTRIRSFLSKMA